MGKACKNFNSSADTLETRESPPMSAVHLTDDIIRAAAGALLSAAACGDAKAFAEAVAKLPDGQAGGFREPLHHRNALHVAALSGKSEICSEAIDKYSFPLDEPDKEGRWKIFWNIH